jgi:hypothetical protein
VPTFTVMVLPTLLVAQIFVFAVDVRVHTLLPILSVRVIELLEVNLPIVIFLLFESNPPDVNVRVFVELEINVSAN